MSSLPNKEYYMLKDIINEHLIEKRSARRWKLFFRFLYLIIFIVILFNVFGDKHLKHGKKVIGVVELKDEINKDNKSYENLMTGLKDAFKDSDVQAVVIKANSPGGSPVYSNMINNAIYQFKKDNPKKPLYFVIEEVCASGCYYAAVAADKIYANVDSVVGSIGVISPGFGATELIKKLGLDSRLQVAGKYKAMGYPFQENKPEYALIRQQILNIVHKEFIDAVKVGRGKKLVMDGDLFTGRYWLGTQALTLGLIDGISSVDDLAKQMDNAEVVDYTASQSSFDKFKRFAVSMFDNNNQMLAQKSVLM
jgi:protease-4